MANQVKMAVHEAIVAYARLGWSRRKISRTLGIDRETVARYLGPVAAKPAIPPAGTEVPKPAIPPAGADPTSAVLPDGIGGCAGHAGRTSQCLAFHALIEEALAQGLSAQRIYQDLVQETAFSGRYDAVKRYVRRLRVEAPERFYRLERAPGEEAQVDFGRGAPIRAADGTACKSWVLRIVLSYSRKAYSEAVLRQTTEAFIRCLENAFRYFGGVIKSVVLDNMRAAVKRADWFEPELNPKVREFCRHYGTVMLPIRVATPRHNGKAESSIGYVKANALKGRVFSSLAEENAHLLAWESLVADRRIHGTTRQQVQARFEQERSRLLPLPSALFPCFQEGKRRVHRDSFVEVDKAYYEVPEEYIQRDLWVRWDSRMVRIFNERFEPVIVHARVDKGRFSYSQKTTSRGRLLGVERSAGWLVQKAVRIGAHCGAWADAALAHRGVEAIRPLYGLLALCRSYPATRIDQVCALALRHGRFLLKDLRRLLDSPAGEPQQTLPFLESHPLIRDIHEYGQFLQDLYPDYEGRNPTSQEATKA